MHEPKNRLPHSLPILERRVDHADGSYKTCPNGMAASAVWGHTGKRPDFPAEFLQHESELFDVGALEPVPGLSSVISGGPAVVYRADDLEASLTPDELLRLASHSLRPDEYFVLRDRFGLFHDIHEDFYDPDTGEAFQPMFDEEDEVVPPPTGRA